MSYKALSDKGRVPARHSRKFPVGHLLQGAAAVLAIFVAGGARAADMQLKAPQLPAPTPLTWEGFYLGANGGGAWGSSCWSFVDTVPSGLGGPPAGEGCHNPNGGFAGVQFGYNFQAGAWVFGLEAQEDWANWQSQNVSAAFPTTTNRTRINGFGLFTGRIGYAAGPALFYAKGGAAAVQDNVDFFGTLFGFPVSGAAGQTQWAGTVGGGLEYKFARNWSAAVEYDFIALGNRQYTLNTTLGVASIENINQNMNLVAARLHYYFQ